MQTQFKTLPQLLDFFKDEETCKAYYEQQRWGGNVACPHCGSLKVYRTNRGFKCGEKECYKKFSLTVGTIFENSKIPLRTWFAAMYLCTTSKKGISSVQLSEQLGITQKTAWFVLSRIRTMLFDENQEKLTGTVEVDETYVGGKNKNRHENKKVKHSTGRSTADKTPVVGVLQRDGKVLTFVVKNTDAETLHGIMVDNVSKDAMLITDAYTSYKGLENNFANYVVVKHTANNFKTDRHFHTNNIENFWSIFKRGIVGIYHNVSPKHLHRYCNEFSYRYNNRKIDSIERFEEAVKQVSNVRITYNGLIGK